MSFVARIANRCKDLLFLPGTDGHWLRLRRGSVACLLYHRVSEPGSAPFLDGVGAAPITPDDLAAEMRFLQAQGATFLTMADLRQGRFPSTSEFGVVVTFDDGFRDNYTLGLQVLDTLGIRGTIFQATGMVDATTLLWEHALYWYQADAAAMHRLAGLAHARMPALNPLTGSDLVFTLRERSSIDEVESLLAAVREIEGNDAAQSEAARSLYPSTADLQGATRRGHEVGSHGHRHVPRRNMDADRFEQELVRSKEVLAKALGAAPLAFSYPFNSREPGDRAICARHFTQAMTVDAQLITRGTDPLALPRFNWPGPHRNALRRRRWLLTGRL